MSQETRVFTAVDYEDSSLIIEDDGGTAVTIWAKSILEDPERPARPIIIDKGLLLGLMRQFQKHHIPNGKTKYRAMSMRHSGDLFALFIDRYDEDGKEIP